jgi:nucleotide-binding universal stress UspA family protein
MDISRDISRDTSPAPGSIVVGVDGSVGSADALTWAADQARLEHRPLAVVHVVNDRIGLWAEQPGVVVDEMLDAMRTHGRQLLDGAVAALRAAHDDTLVVQPVLAQGDPRQVLIDASAHAAGLVLGSRGRGPIASLLLGSVSVGVTRLARCPVVVLRPEEGSHAPRTSPQHVVVGVVHGQPVGQAVEFAFRQASLRTLPLVVLHAPWEALMGWAATGGMALATDLSSSAADEEATAVLVTGLREKFPDVAVTYAAARGFPEAYLLGGAHDADMIVVGTRHPSLATAVIEGNLARAVTEHAHCLVAVVPES